MDMRQNNAKMRKRAQHVTSRDIGWGRRSVQNLDKPYQEEDKTKGEK